MTRKYFGTDGIRGLANKYPITAEFALKLGTAAGHYFGSRHDGFRVVIGKDTRRSCYMLEAALTAGLISVGAQVMWLGPVPTPAVGMLTKSMRADFGIMISASHNPFYDNGIKLFGQDGFKLSDEIEQEIEALIDNYENVPLIKPDKLGRNRRCEDSLARYIEIVKASLPKEQTLEGIKVVVDCANGAAYKAAPNILFELGADVIPLHVAPDGLNINKDCGALHPDILRETVLKNHADVGIALDGDADRIIMCDAMGNILDGDVIIGMIARSLKEQGKLAHNHVVTTVMSNMGLKEFLRENDISNTQTAVGDRYVVAEMRKNGYNLGGEQSGHIVLADYATTGDGLLASLQVLSQMVAKEKELHELSQIFMPYPQLLTNIRYREVNPLEDAVVKQAILEAEKEMGEEGRVFIRKSGTEPLIRVMVEGKSIDKTMKISKELTKLIEEKVS